MVNKHGSGQNTLLLLVVLVNSGATEIWCVGGQISVRTYGNLSLFGFYPALKGLLNK